MFSLDGILPGFGLVLARTSALILSTPVLGFGTGFSGYKIALVFSLSVVLFMVVGMPLDAGFDAIGYSAMALREVLIGVYLGFFLQLALVAVRVGGEMIGQEMGFMVARQVDPASGVQSSLVTNLYENLFILTLLLLNGHHWIIRSLEKSFERAPIGQLSLGKGMAATVQQMFGQMFGAGIVFAAPVMIFLVLVSILIGLLARAVPTLNVLEIGFSVRVLIALFAMFLFAPLLEPAMSSLQVQFLAWLDRGLDALGG